MLEYRLKSMNAALKNDLKKIGLDTVEESFKRKKSWLIYTDKPIESLLKKHDTEFTVQSIADTGWEEKWKDYLEEGWLTDSVYYVYDDKTFDDDRQVIRINPALAFGTGSHPTTQLAARLLEKAANGQDVLDIGTGSGILSILAEIKGAKKVYACDIDDMAMTNAQENIQLNGCRNITTWVGGIESVAATLQPTVVVANIISSALIQIHPYVLPFNPKYIIYSGILRKDETTFMQTISTPHYQTDEALHMNKWSAVRLKAVS